MKALAAAAVIAAASVPVADGATVVPNPSRLGDVLTVTVPATARPSFGAFAVRSRRTLGGGDVRYEIQCLDSGCAPGNGVRRIALRGLPEIVVVPRVTAREVASPAASLRRETALPPPRYRVDPSLLRALLALAAALCGGVAIALLYGRREPDEQDPLERALALVRASAARGVADRRRALDLLARTVPDFSILDVAWTGSEPTAECVLSVADSIEAKQ